MRSVRAAGARDTLSCLESRARLFKRRRLGVVAALCERSYCRSTGVDRSKVDRGFFPADSSGVAHLSSSVCVHHTAPQLVGGGRGGRAGARQRAHDGERHRIGSGSGS